MAVAGEDPAAVTLADRMNGMTLTRNMVYYEDETHTLDFHDVFRKDIHWLPMETDAVNFGFSNSAYWFKFSVFNPLRHDLQWFLELNYPLLDRIDLYSENETGDVAHIRMGDHFPFSQRQVIDRNFIFRLKQPPGRSTLYMRIETSSSVNFTPKAWSTDAFISHLNRQVPIFWIYNGLLMVMAVYNLLIFMSVRDRSYLYYFLFICGYVLFTLTLSGASFQYLWPDSVWWANNCLPFFMCFDVIWIGMFGRTYLKSSQLFPRLDKLIISATLAPNLIWCMVSFFMTYAVSIRVATLLVMVSSLTLYTACWIVYCLGSKPAKTLLISFSIVFFGVMLHSLKTFGLLPAYPIINWSIQIGASCMVVLLSLGLADKINSMKNDLAVLNRELEDRVKERTVQLELANTDLQRSLDTLKITQKQLVQSEKMAALGGLVAGVAHEINTPLAVGITAASLLEDKTSTFTRTFIEGDMKRNTLESYVRVATETAGMILKNLERAAELVRSFKQVAVDQSAEDMRKFNIKNQIEELLISLRLNLKRGRHHITFTCPEDIWMTSYPGALAQVVTNLVMNSVIHGFENTDGGSIRLDARRTSDAVTLTYTDDGKGMDESTREKVFDPFFTTKRDHGGTGLGMHILFNIVTQTLHGHMECESAPGKGVEFKILLPTNLETPKSKTGFVAV